VTASALRERRGKARRSLGTALASVIARRTAADARMFLPALVRGA